MARGITRDRDRHGNVRLYFRRRGQPKIRLHEREGTEAFEQELAAARLGVPYVPDALRPVADARPRRISAPQGSLRWLVEEYMRRAVAGQAPATRIKKRAVLDEICRETVISKSGAEAGLAPYRHLERRHIALLRDQKAASPAAADHRTKVLSAMFAWAIDAGLATDNPARGLGKLAGRTDGHHTLTRDELAAFEQRHPPGTMAYAAMTVFRYTGLRVCDAVRLGHQHLYTLTDSAGEPQLRFRITPDKTRGSSGVVVDLPVLPPLAAVIASLPATSALTFITTEHGKPFSTKGLGQRMRKWFDAAGLTHCSSHGIRKADAVIAAENGATSKELQAMFGWTSSREADRYTKKAERQRLGTSGAPSLMLVHPRPKT